jgi:hypothetical protein
MEARMSKNFLVWIGYITIILGILGFIHVLGPTPQTSIFGSFWWMDGQVSLIYIMGGIVSLFTAYVMPDNVVELITYGIGAVAFFVGLYGLFWAPRVFSVPLEGVIGNLIMFLFGVWGLWSVSVERISLMRRCRMGDSEACNMLGMKAK